MHAWDIPEIADDKRKDIASYIVSNPLKVNT